MDNYEEYLLRVLRRTTSGLQDSLIPAHAAKLSKLEEKFESTASIIGEIASLKNVNGFSKCAVAMEWLIERTKRPEEDFSPEQFESDILLMNEKLFEAFLNQPFDMPDYNVKEHDDVPNRPIQKDLQMSADEFLLMGGESQSIQTSVTSSILESSTEKIDQWNPVMSDPYLQPSQSLPDTKIGEISPSLRDVMTSELLDFTTSIAAKANEFPSKSPNERPVAIAVLRVGVKAALETSKSTNNVIVQDFYQTFLNLISFADREGKIRSDVFVGIMTDVGDRLTNALNETKNGVNVLKSLTTFISDPKKLFSKS